MLRRAPGAVRASKKRLGPPAASGGHLRRPVGRQSCTHLRCTACPTSKSSYAASDVQPECGTPCPACKAARGRPAARNDHSITVCGAPANNRGTAKTTISVLRVRRCRVRARSHPMDATNTRAPEGPQTPLEGFRRREGPWAPSKPARSATRLLKALTAISTDWSASPRAGALCRRTGPWTASAASSSNRHPRHGHPAKVPTDVVSRGPAGD